MRCIGIPAFGVASACALLWLAAPAQAELVVNISKAQQRLAVVVDGKEFYRWPVSTGLRRYQTPAGTFRPIRLERHWYSRKYNLTPMPWSMFFHRGYAVHGTMEAHNLGRAASHGCVRLRPDNASTLYSLIRRQGKDNTRIVVMNGPLPPPPTVPGDLPMADSGTPSAATSVELVAKAGRDGGERADAKAQTVRIERSVKPRHVARAAYAAAREEDLSVAVGDDASVMRSRAAWLRSLDRKYGIMR